MKGKYTPGPWSVNHWNNSETSGVTCHGTSSDGINFFTGDNVHEQYFNIVSRIDPMKHNVSASFEGAHIAKLNCFSDESRANAKLISASPEMAEALQVIVDQCRKELETWASMPANEPNNSTQLLGAIIEIIETAQKALSKAIGAN